MTRKPKRRVHAVADAIKMEKNLEGSKMISNWKVKEMGRSREWGIKKCAKIHSYLVQGIYRHNQLETLTENTV